MAGVVSVYSDITDLVLAQQRAQHMITQTVAVFVRAIEAVDPYLCGQSTFTAQLAVALAYCLGLNNAETVATLRTAASLSQIGMIQLPRELLTKSGALSPAEREELHRHVEYARRALEGIDFGLPVLEAHLPDVRTAGRIRLPGRPHGGLDLRQCAHSGRGQYFLRAAAAALLPHGP